MNIKDYVSYSVMLEFYKGKRVFISGNTGFKGTWMTYILLIAGAFVMGYALEPSTEPALYTLMEFDQKQNFRQVYGDVRDLDKMKKVFDEFKPEVVFHLAAQPIVRTSYLDPVNTYSTNVMGTVNICECIRTTVDSSGKPIVRSFLNVTTDKVYKNNEWCYGYREIDILDGMDPYSNSKSCSELVTHSYKDSFFKHTKEDDRLIIGISTARAGNVIGGGDFSKDRILPDCIKSLFRAKENGLDKAVVEVRNPFSIRPYQHVLEPIFAYLLIAYRQWENDDFGGYYNVGPDDVDCVTTGELVDLFKKHWNESNEIKFEWKDVSIKQKGSPHEAGLLKLNCDKIKKMLKWTPTWNIEDAVVQTISFVKVMLDNDSNKKKIQEEMNREINNFLKFNLKK